MDEIREMYESGLSIKSIAEKIGRSGTYVHARLKKLGIKRVTVRNPLKVRSEEALALYNDGWTHQQIADKFGCLQGNISKLLSGKEKRTWKYFVDESYFNEIDSENKAYMLGWIFSDGNVTDDGKFRIQIKDKDIKILEWMKEELQYEGPIYRCKNEMAEFCVNRKSMALDLIRHGAVPNKSLILKFPKLRSDLLPHFMRGMYDGDGCLRIHQGRYLNTCLTSSVDFLNDWSKVLRGMEIRHQIYYKKGKPLSPSLMTSQKDNSLLLCHYLYENSTIYLERKHLIYLEALALG